MRRARWPWCVAALAVALGLCLASGTAFSASSRQMPAVLYGVSVGESAKAALARLGLAPPRAVTTAGVPAGTKAVAEYRVFLADGGRVFVGLSFDTKIRVIVVHPNGAHSTNIADPFGVRLGDSPGRLRELRGRPDSISHGEWVYGKLHGLHWFYAVEGNRVKAIGVGDES